MLPWCKRVLLSGVGEKWRKKLIFPPSRLSGLASQSPVFMWRGRANKRRVDERARHWSEIARERVEEKKGVDGHVRAWLMRDAACARTGPFSKQSRWTRNQTAFFFAFAPVWTRENQQSDVEILFQSTTRLSPSVVLCFHYMVHLENIQLEIT